MKRNTPLAVALATMVLLLAAPCHATPADVSDGLIRLQTRALDEVYVRPDVDFQRYNKVLVDPPQVTLRKGWLRSINATRGPSRWLVPEDAANITDSAAAGLGAVVAESFRQRGYEIAAAPEVGVLRVSANVSDLIVNAPDVSSAYMQAQYNVNAGEATLTLELRDATSGALLGRVVDRSVAHELSPRINRSFGVTNQFWFDALFRQWTANSMQEFADARLLR